MEKGGLYNRGSILLNKSSRKVDKNHSMAVKSFTLSKVCAYRTRNSKQLRSL